MGNCMPDGLIPPYSLIEHGGQHWDAAIHVIINHHFFFAIMKPMQAAHVLLHGSFPGNGHGQKQSVKPGIIKTLPNVTALSFSMMALRCLNKANRAGEERSGVWIPAIIPRQFLWKLIVKFNRTLKHA